MVNNINKPKRTANRNLSVGIILLTLGGILLLRQSHLLLFPHWIFSLPVLLIIGGLALGAKNNYQKQGWLMLVMAGVLLLISKVIGIVIFGLWPLLIIAFGVSVLLKHHNNDNNKRGNYKIYDRRNYKY